MDRDAYNRALEDGSLQGIAEQSFYNNMAAYAEWLGSGAVGALHSGLAALLL